MKNDAFKISKKRKAIIIFSAVVLFIAAAITAYVCYYNSALVLSPSKSASDYNIETIYCDFSKKALIPKKAVQTADKIRDDSVEHAQYINKNYTKPADVKVTMEVKDGKTIISYSGYVTNLNGQKENYSKSVSYDYVLTRNVPKYLRGE